MQSLTMVFIWIGVAPALAVHPPLQNHYPSNASVKPNGKSETSPRFQFLPL